MTTDPRRIAVLGGTGALGSGLARRLAAAGHRLVIGSRDAERAAASVRRAFPDASDAVTGADYLGAVEGADLVVLTVPFAAHAGVLRAVARALDPGQVLLDVTVPLAPAIGGRPTRTIGVWQGSAAEQAQELVGPVPVVAALHSVSAVALADTARELHEDTLVCGDDAPAKLMVASLLRDIPGLRPVDAGRLESARIIEPVTALMIGVNRRYKTHAGLRLTGLPSELWAAAQASAPGGG